ncbi:MAG TPA: glycosyltransferase family 2 protein [Myxococcota bacterium]|nr:glycosyltransferase family 2 protein [Myxococcota bacterium]
MGPRISVIMPVYQEGQFIQLALDDLLRQSLDLEDGREASLEVLVVDGGSTDDTRSRALATASRDPRVRLLRNPRRLSSAGRAIGVEAATGELVAIIDGHCRIPSSSLLRDMVALFERTGADCLARPAPLVARDPTYWTEAICAARASRFGHNLGSTLWDTAEHPADPRSAGAMYRRSVFQRVGNFDPSFDACEDVEFNGRIRTEGLSCWTSPKLAVQYEPRRSLAGLWRQMFRYGVGWADVQRKRAGTLTLGPVVAGVFVAGGVALCVTPLLPEWLMLAAVAPYAVYLATSIAASLAIAARRPRLLPALPAVFFVLHAGLGTGYLWGLARSDRRDSEQIRTLAREA